MKNITKKALLMGLLSLSIVSPACAAWQDWAFSKKGFAIGTLCLLGGIYLYRTWGRKSTSKRKLPEQPAAPSQEELRQQVAEVRARRKAEEQVCKEQELAELQEFGLASKSEMNKALTNAVTLTYKIAIKDFDRDTTPTKIPVNIDAMLAALRYIITYGQQSGHLSAAVKSLAVITTYLAEQDQAPSNIDSIKKSLQEHAIKFDATPFGNGFIEPALDHIEKRVCERQFPEYYANQASYGGRYMTAHLSARIKTTLNISR